MNVDDRVARNLLLAEPDLRDLDERTRLALRYFFSTAVALEQIAVIAADNGRGVPGQVEDEVVHRETFKALALELGGLTDIPEVVKELAPFIIELPTEELSRAILNVVAETWLENVFKAVARGGVCKEMFTLIGREEARHSRDVLSAALPDPDEVTPYVRELERMLFLLTNDPYFMAPLIHLIGVKAVAVMGRQITDQHQVALGRLGVEPTAALGEIIRCGADANHDIEPTPVEGLSEWQRTAWNISFTGPIGAIFKVPCPDDLDQEILEAVFVRAVGRVLARFKRLNRTFNSALGCLYQCHQDIVSVRRVRSVRGDPMTVTLRVPSRRSPKTIARSLKGRTWRARLSPPIPIPDLTPIHTILPAPRAAAVVSNLNAAGYESGFTAIVDTEGASFSVGIGGFERVPKRGWLGLVRWESHVNVTVTADHRAVSGLGLGLFKRALCEELSEIIEKEL